MVSATRRTRELGQNFLRDPNILGVIARAAELPPPRTHPPQDAPPPAPTLASSASPPGGPPPRAEGEAGEVILEVGGGEGVLSAYLAPRAEWVHVVELDERLRPALEGSLEGHENVTVWWGDAMRLDLAALQPRPTKMVANLPYGIAAGVVLRTLEELEGVQMWVVMVQREVGERLAAAPGNGAYGVSSVLAQLAGDVRVVRGVPRTVFRPVPNVDSVLVKIVRTGPAPPPPLRRLVGAAFAHRRKALARSLVLSGSERTREQIRAALVELGHPADARAERLSPADFTVLARKLGVS
jgi:16S rRNA (adenine1518-N6/adenine1519-N6)-dimethyltransferase